MKTRLVLALAALSLVVAACGSEPSGQDGTVMRYGLQPGSDLSYDVEQVMEMTMSAGDAGSEALMGLVGGMSWSMDARSTMGYSISEGPEPDTVEIRILTEVVRGTMTIGAMGESQTFDLADAPEMAEVAAVEMVLVIDPTGEIVDLSVGGESIPLGLFGDSLNGLMGQSFGSNGFSGPVFPDDPLSVGETWVVDDSANVLGMDFEATSAHTYVGDETIAGRLVARIESTTILAALDVDLIEMIQEMMESPDLADMAGVEGEDMELAFAMFEALDVQMHMTTEESVAISTTWFDPVDGVVVKSTVSQPLTMSLSMANVPEMEGDMSLDMSTEIEQTMTLRD